jgi:hypothetical protein
LIIEIQKLKLENENIEKKNKELENSLKGQINKFKELLIDFQSIKFDDESYTKIKNEFELLNEKYILQIENNEVLNNKINELNILLNSKNDEILNFQKNFIDLNKIENEYENRILNMTNSLVDKYNENMDLNDKLKKEIKKFKNLQSEFDQLKLKSSFK